MDKINSISIVNTQMQLINSMEAVSAYNCNNNWLINGNFSQQRNEQIESFYRRHNLNKIYAHYINLRLIKCDDKVGSYINLLYAKIVLLFILVAIKMDYVFIGHYLNAIHRYIIRRSYKKNPKCKSVLVDDGTGTMLFAHERGMEQREQKDVCSYDHSTKLLFKPNRNEFLIPHSLEYFTIYPIQGLLDNDSIKNNDYAVVKAMNNTSDAIIQSNTMVIVGQTLVEENIVTPSKYEDLLTHAIDVAKKKYGIVNFIYCPHPGEKNVESKLIDVNNLHIHRNKDPFELFALTFPKTCIISGFFSSSLWNLTYLGLEASIKFIKIDDNDILCGEPMKSHIYNIYKTYNNSKSIKML